MANTQTLAELIVAIREQADIVGLETRHSDAQLIRWINQSWRSLRTQLSNSGFSFFLEGTTQTALPTAAPTADEQFLEVDYPDGAVGIYGFDVLRGSYWTPLCQGSFAARRDYQSRAGRLTSGVETFVVRSVPVESTTTTTAGKIMLFPLNTEGLDYRIWYLPVWADITTTSFAFYGHDVWFEWLIWDVCRKVFIRDNDSSGALKGAESSRAELWGDIVKAIQTMQSAGPEVPRSPRRRRGRGRF